MSGRIIQEHDNEITLHSSTETTTQAVQDGAKSETWLLCMLLGNCVVLFLLNSFSEKLAQHYWVTKPSFFFLFHYTIFNGEP